jgi:hypothetical protein
VNQIEREINQTFEHPKLENNHLITSPSNVIKHADFHFFTSMNSSMVVRDKHMNVPIYTLSKWRRLSIHSYFNNYKLHNGVSGLSKFLIYKLNRVIIILSSAAENCPFEEDNNGSFSFILRHYSLLLF